MIEKQFTALLRSFVQDTAPKTEEPWNMAELQRAAAQQNMEAAVGADPLTVQREQL